MISLQRSGMMKLRKGETMGDYQPSISESEEKALSRRAFLKVGVGGGLLVAIGSKWLPFSEAMAQVQSEYALIIDLNKCTGCGACTEACNQRNDLPEGQSFIHRIKNFL